MKESSMMVARLSVVYRVSLDGGYIKNHTSEDLFCRMNLSSLVRVYKVSHGLDLGIALVSARGVRNVNSEAILHATYGLVS